MSPLYEGAATRDPGSLRRFIASAEVRPGFFRVLMVDPEFFQVRYEINPHMRGNAGAVDPGSARTEWSAIKAAYEGLGYEVLVMPGSPEFPDLVFAANPCLPFPDRSRPGVLLSNMARPERKGEVALVRAFLERRGFACDGRFCDDAAPATATDGPFEGTGDAVWHPGMNLIWGGHGFRTSLKRWSQVGGATRIIPLKLVDERCYHLDVCLMPVNEDTAFACRAAFDEESWARLSAGFANLIAADENETMNGFALNGHCPDGKHLLLPAGNPLTRAAAEKLDLTVHELSTREFQKAGGSIFCLKNMLPAAARAEAG